MYDHKHADPPHTHTHTVLQLCLFYYIPECDAALLTKSLVKKQGMIRFHLFIRISSHMFAITYQFCSKDVDWESTRLFLEASVQMWNVRLSYRKIFLLGRYLLSLAKYCVRDFLSLIFTLLNVAVGHFRFI